MIRRGLATLALLLAGAAPASEVELRHGEDVLDHGRPGWRETALRLEWSRAGEPGIEVAASRIERSGQLDHGFAAAARAPLGARWELAVEGGASATHHVVPAWLAGGRARVALATGLAALAAVRWSRFDGGEGSSTAGLGTLGVEYYRSAHRLAWTTYVSRIEGAWSSSQAAAWDVFYGARDRIGVVLSAGRELESLGGGRVLATRSRAAAVVGRTALGPAWSLTYGVELQRQGELYSRAGGRLGLARGF